ncbi:MAG: LptA/OstA family protein, partial [Helicobacteraceae bacterium]|nr:LptA/OstA family protein [Helicobacteraceae bacterium]
MSLKCSFLLAALTVSLFAEKIEIAAREFETNGERSIFKGNVVVTRTNSVMKAQQLIVIW